MASYEIELLPSGASGAGDKMYRSGKQFTLREPQVLELTDEQVEVFKNDARFKVMDSNEPGQPLETGTVGEAGEGTAEVATETAEETAAVETEAVQDSPVEQAEEVGTEDAPVSALPTVDELLRDHDRDELNAIAKDLGVKKPQKLESKEEVAQAIVDAR
jgi:hypothetical protein